MNQSLQPLIAGAGPVGLAAALFLTRNGQTPRVIEQRHEPSRQSKALAVNPRTLDLLGPTGVTEQMLEIGLPVHGVRFYRNDRNVASLSLAGIHPKYPYMLGLSQATTERLLAKALRAAGGKVERGMKLVKCRGTATGVEAEIEPTNGGFCEKIECPWLLAAEGAHSVAREQLGIEFSGSAFPDDWHLVDVPLRTSLAQDVGHAFFLSDGALLFMIRVIDDTLKDRGGEPIWRIIANRSDPLSHLRQAEQTEPPLWESNFRISHRINATMASNNVYFAGDSAHIHSPIGAKGMNLGIEDAWVLAELARKGRLSEYDRFRRPVDQAVVRTVEVLSRIAAAESSLDRVVREWLAAHRHEGAADPSSHAGDSQWAGPRIAAIVAGGPASHAREQGADSSRA